MAESLTGQVAIVTGASSGIGRDTALELARAGVRVVLASRNAAALQALATDIQHAGGEAFVRATDVSNPIDAAGLVEDALARFGRIDIVIASAGQYIRGTIATRTLADFESSLQVNFYGALAVIQAALPHMLAARRGMVVAVTSVDGKKGLPLDGPYVAAKFALTGYMDVLRQELHGTGVHVLTILPGRVDTPMIASLDVPLISAKISSRRVARTIVHRIRRGVGTEVIVPFLGPSLLLWAHMLSPRLADVLVRILKLEGVEAGHR
jgi:NAD(P)-dependent dehydrogenase (short-subunit alcohol dehydrogenase family)